MPTYQRRQGIMLCQPLSDSNINRLPTKCYLQPKLNGGRCRTEWCASTPVLLSSEGNAFWGLTHITDILQSLPQLPLDGELYLHGWSRERIHSAISRKSNSSSDAAQIEYHIFDIQLPAPQRARFQGLINYFAELHQNLGHNIPVKLVPTSLIDRDTWPQQAQHYVSLGYEGIILRHPETLYQKDKRPASCIKFKPTETDQYLIIDTHEAISIDGYPKAMIGAFTVEDPEGNQFNVSAGKLTHSERTKLWHIRETLPHRFLEVKHELITTTNKVPVACVAVKVLFAP